MEDSQLRPIVKELTLNINIDTKGKTNREIILRYFREALEYVHIKRSLLMEFIADECVFDSEFNELIDKYLINIIRLMPKYKWDFLRSISLYNSTAIKNNIEALFSIDNETDILNIFLAIKNNNRELDLIINKQIQKNSKLFTRALWHGTNWRARADLGRCF